jgi:hypothetical protein
MLQIISIIMALQVGVYELPPEANVQYRFITSTEENAPVATCDAQFNCHCPVGYRAVVAQNQTATAATSVSCVPVNSSSKQPRETFDSYPMLPRHDNFEK